MGVMFRELCELVGVGGLYTLGSLRAGGATWFFMVGKDIGWLQFRGRWAVPGTLAHYLQEGLAAYVGA